MWEFRGTEIDHQKLGSLKPVEVLYEYDGEPLTYVANDPDGEPLLVHSLSVFERTSRYLVSAIDGRILNDLKAGRIDILSALRQPRCWIADLTEDASVKSLWRVQFSSIPEKVLPKSGAMVNPEDDPLFSIRLIGSGVGPGKTSAGDVRLAAQAAESGLRGLARIALDEQKKAGKVPREIRHYSDLPYQFSRAASFEIAFGRPMDRLPAIDDEIFQEMGTLLEKGLVALRDDDETATQVKGLSDEQTVRLFEAIKALTPPLRGGVERVEVGGTLVDHVSGSHLLTRDDRTRSNQRIKSSTKRPYKEAPFRVAGMVQGADVGTFQFTLRQIEPPEVPGVGTVPEILFTFDDCLFDAVSDAWNSQDRVVVVGERIGNEFRAIEIQLIAETVDNATGIDNSGSE